MSEEKIIDAEVIETPVSETPVEEVLGAVAPIVADEVDGVVVEVNEVIE